MLFIQNSNGLTPIDIALEISKDGDGSLLKKKDAVEKEETKLTKFQKVCLKKVEEINQAELLAQQNEKNNKIVLQDRNQKTQISDFFWDAIDKVKKDKCY